MSTKIRSSPLGAEGIAAIVIMLGASALLVEAVPMPTMSAMLPIAMLVFLIGLGAIMLVRNVIVRRKGVVQERLVRRPKRAIGAYFAIVIYTLLVSLIGFYTSTVLMVPLVGWIFGYRNLPRLMLATAIFVGGIFVIFNLAMGQQFPVEFFVR